MPNGKQQLMFQPENGQNKIKCTQDLEIKHHDDFNCHSCQCRQVSCQIDICSVEVQSRIIKQQKECKNVWNSTISNITKGIKPKRKKDKLFNNVIICIDDDDKDILECSTPKNNMIDLVSPKKPQLPVLSPITSSDRSKVVSTPIRSKKSEKAKTFLENIMNVSGISASTPVVNHQNIFGQSESTDSFLEETSERSDSCSPFISPPNDSVFHVLNVVSPAPVQNVSNTNQGRQESESVQYSSTVDFPPLEEKVRRQFIYNNISNSPNHLYYVNKHAQAIKKAKIGILKLKEDLKMANSRDEVRRIQNEIKEAEESFQCTFIQKVDVDFNLPKISCLPHTLRQNIYDNVEASINDNSTHSYKYILNQKNQLRNLRRIKSSIHTLKGIKNDHLSHVYNYLNYLERQYLDTYVDLTDINNLSVAFSNKEIIMNAVNVLNQSNNNNESMSSTSNTSSIYIGKRKRRKKLKLKNSSSECHSDEVVNKMNGCDTIVNESISNSTRGINCYNETSSPVQPSLSINTLNSSNHLEDNHPMSCRGVQDQIQTPKRLIPNNSYTPTHNNQIVNSFKNNRARYRPYKSVFKFT